MTAGGSHPAYRVYGPDHPLSPIVISIPHAGREYAPELIAAARVPLTILRRLEDRHADALVTPLLAAGRHRIVMANAARAMIDLNRDHREIDPGMLKCVPHGVSFIASAKSRGGLGLIPRRLSGAGELWHGPLAFDEAQQRIETLHRPYHEAVAQALRQVREQFGHAVLIDLHSMPPLMNWAQVNWGAGPQPRFVLGDRFGRSASSRLIARAGDYLSGRGFCVSHNHPYPGNYILARHGNPDRDIHAIQVEVDRSLYLDADMDGTGPGLARCQQLITGMVEAVEQLWPRSDFLQAAE